MHRSGQEGNPAFDQQTVQHIKQAGEGGQPVTQRDRHLGGNRIRFAEERCLFHEITLNPSGGKREHPRQMEVHPIDCIQMKAPIWKGQEKVDTKISFL